MEYALESSQDGVMVEADWAEAKRGYLCPSCHRAVFLRQGIIKKRHFSHHVEKQSTCPEYHSGTGISRSQIVRNFQTQLSLGDYIRRWNSIIRSLLRRDWLVDCHGSESLIRPISRFLYFEETTRTELNKFVQFFRSFTRDQLTKYNCNVDEILNWATGKFSIISCETEGFVRLFERLSPSEKYIAMRVLLEYASTGEEKYSGLVLHKIGLTDFSLFRSDGQFYRIPFESIPQPEEYEVIVRNLQRDKFEVLLGSAEIPEKHRIYLRQKYTDYFEKPSNI